MVGGKYFQNYFLNFWEVCIEIMWTGDFYISRFCDLEIWGIFEFLGSLSWEITRLRIWGFSRWRDLGTKIFWNIFLKFFSNLVMVSGKYFSKLFYEFFWKFELRSRDLRTWRFVDIGISGFEGFWIFWKFELGITRFEDLRIWGFGDDEIWEQNFFEIFFGIIFSTSFFRLSHGRWQIIFKINFWIFRKLEITWFGVFGILGFGESEIWEFWDLGISESKRFRNMTSKKFQIF